MLRNVGVFQEKTRLLISVSPKDICIDIDRGKDCSVGYYVYTEILLYGYCFWWISAFALKWAGHEFK